jgi:hypothetical protein
MRDFRLNLKNHESITEDERFSYYWLSCLVYSANSDFAGKMGNIAKYYIPPLGLPITEFSNKYRVIESEDLEERMTYFQVKKK